MFQLNIPAIRETLIAARWLVQDMGWSSDRDNHTSTSDNHLFWYRSAPIMDIDVIAARKKCRYQYDAFQTRTLISALTNNNSYIWEHQVGRTNKDVLNLIDKAIMACPVFRKLKRK